MLRSMTHEAKFSTKPPTQCGIHTERFTSMYSRQLAQLISNFSQDAQEQHIPTANPCLHLITLTECHTCTSYKTQPPTPLGSTPVLPESHRTTVTCGRLGAVPLAGAMQYKTPPMSATLVRIPLTYSKLAKRKTSPNTSPQILTQLQSLQHAVHYRAMP
jgi:hypothetical protein